MSAIQTFRAVPGVLIAVPQLGDPNFRRSVVVMLEHDDQGALGLVINQPLPHACADVAQSFGLTWGGAPESRLRRGGPVEPQSLWILHEDRLQFDETSPVAPGIAVSRSREALTGLCEGGERPVRLVVGYAGWGPGQLEGEMASGSWIQAPVSPALVFEWAPEAIWDRALAGLGIDPVHLAGATDVLQ
ncbi:MAG: YqgE/AlgH family protein [Myxococcales bacterium]|nr:YqgE/AlgH family protein [Myxococcales bacterium]